MQFTKKLSRGGGPVPHPHAITVSGLKPKFKEWSLVLILLVMSYLSALAQTNLIVVTDWTKSTKLTLHAEDLSGPINALMNARSGGEISVIFITDGIPNVFSVHIDPFQSKTSRTAIDRIRKREAKIQYKKSVEFALRRFLMEINRFISSTPKFMGSDINAAINAVNVKLNEPHLTGHRPIVIFHTDGCQSRKRTAECLCSVEKISNRIDRTNFIYVGWQKNECRPTDHHTDYSALDGALRYSSNFLIKKIN